MLNVRSWAIEEDNVAVMPLWKLKVQRGLIDVVVFGAGLRGLVSYGTNLERAGLRPVAVVDPLASRRDAFGELLEVHRFVEELLDLGRGRRRLVGRQGAEGR